jgi:hypothetical protein
MSRITDPVTLSPEQATLVRSLLEREQDGLTLKLGTPRGSEIDRMVWRKRLDEVREALRIFTWLYGPDAPEYAAEFVEAHT